MRLCRNGRNHSKILGCGLSLDHEDGRWVPRLDLTVLAVCQSLGSTVAELRIRALTVLPRLPKPKADGNRYGKAEHPG